MQITALSKILKAKRQGDRLFVVAFEADAETFELFLAGAGYPGEFTGFMAPSVRRQSTGQSWVIEWAQAELIAAQFGSALDTAGAEKAVAVEVVNALISGRRYGLVA